MWRAVSLPGNGSVTEALSERSVSKEWPSFGLRYTFNPQELAGREPPDPDELVVFDPREERIGAAWVTAARESYVSIEDVR